MGFGMNSGYVGWSMSVRAAAAYEDGEMPKSKWTKTAMLDRIDEFFVDEDIPAPIDFSLMTKEELFGMCFMRSSWHHTSKYCNETIFYELDEDKVRGISYKAVNEYRADNGTGEYWRVKTEDGRTLTGGIKGAKFLGDDGTRLSKSRVTLVERLETSQERRYREQRERIERAKAYMDKCKTCIIAQCAAYKERYGYYPDSVMALYRVHPDLFTEDVGHAGWVSYDGRQSYPLAKLAEHRVRDIRNIWNANADVAMHADGLLDDRKWLDPEFQRLPEVSTWLAAPDRVQGRWAERAAVDALEKLWERVYDERKD